MGTVPVASAVEPPAESGVALDYSPYCVCPGKGVAPAVTDVAPCVCVVAGPCVEAICCSYWYVVVSIEPYSPAYCLKAPHFVGIDEMWPREDWPSPPWERD